MMPWIGFAGVTVCVGLAVVVLFGWDEQLVSALRAHLDGKAKP